jgi:hypothetical protein
MEDFSKYEVYGNIKGEYNKNWEYSFKDCSYRCTWDRVSRAGCRQYRQHTRPGR